MSMFVHYLERLIDFWKEAGSFVAGNQRLLSEMVWPHFWAIQILLLVLIAFYCTIHELVRAIGRNQFLRMFLDDRRRRRFDCCKKMRPTIFLHDDAKRASPAAQIEKAGGRSSRHWSRSIRWSRSPVRACW